MIFAWLPKQIENFLILWFHLQQLPLVLVPPKGDENMFSAILCYEKGWPENACIPKCHARFGTFFWKGNSGSVCNLEGWLCSKVGQAGSGIRNPHPGCDSLAVTPWIIHLPLWVERRLLKSLDWKIQREASEILPLKSQLVCLCKWTSVFVKWIPELRALLLAFLAEKGASGKGLVK